MAVVAVTGAAGYVGGMVCRRLLENGFDLIPVDNLYANKVQSIDGQQIISADITNPQQIFSALKDADVIIHLAAIPGVAPCNERPVESFTANVIGTQNLCGISKETKAGIIFAASMAVFGEPKVFPITEKVKMAPVNTYGKQKYLAMKFLLECARLYAFPAFAFLKSNIYGTYNMNGMTVIKPTAVNLFLQKARAGEPITIFKPGTQVRNFIHISDIADAYVLGVKKIKTLKKPRAINIAHQELSVVSIAEQIKQAFAAKGKEVKIDFVENPRKDEVVSEAFSIDTTLAKKLLKFEPKITVQTFLESEI
ncbi:MAG: NAD-dependent epimerase/dehydratase family protein [DPANN group archaeon]|nr:NAD-dependent epimerase/dehydratase family protein [DPANN group archaeon]